MMPAGGAGRLQMQHFSDVQSPGSKTPISLKVSSAGRRCSWAAPGLRHPPRAPSVLLLLLLTFSPLAAPTQLHVEVRLLNHRNKKMRSIVIFYLCYLLCLGLGLACIVCVCLWNSRWRGGFAWDGSGLQFNWHPVLMVTGLVVLYGNGAVLYRIPLTWGQNKLPWKLLHAALMLIALILSIVGLVAVFDFHNAQKISNLYSLHSWIGIVATALFALQWVVGMAGFLLPWSPISLRKLLKPAHVWLGGSIMLLSIAACISGINEKLFFVLKGSASGSKPYSDLPPEAVLGNILGVLIVAFGLVVLKILSNTEWQRPDSRPEDMAYTPLLQEENE